MSSDRIMIFPSRANLVLMKQRIVAANKGLNLLKRKKDALDMKIREINATLREEKHRLNGIMRDAYFAIAKARYMGTDFKPISVIRPERADVFLRIKTGKVVGVTLPTFALVMKPTSCFPFTGLSRGGKDVEVVRAKFQEAIKLLIMLASLEYSLRVLEEAARQNNMRINGLDYVLIPKFVRTVMYIREELDEFEREDFYRLKRSQAKQRKAKAKFTALLKKLHDDHDEFLIPLPEVVVETFNESEFERSNKNAVLPAIGETKEDEEPDADEQQAALTEVVDDMNSADSRYNDPNADPDDENQTPPPA